ncbi:hypothetical protein SDC9_154546 [bioreactor metagenome]|uniref:Uncharacterized protein n=1 Tax=bioreactor metagenome TaxID=1076179 RepID=A0A645F0K5_9ZZZZ
MVPERVHAAMRGPTLRRIPRAPEARETMGSTPSMKRSLHPKPYFSLKRPVVKTPQRASSTAIWIPNVRVPPARMARMPPRAVSAPAREISSRCSCLAMAVPPLPLFLPEEHYTRERRAGKAEKMVGCHEEQRRRVPRGRFSPQSSPLWGGIRQAKDPADFGPP